MPYIGHLFVHEIYDDSLAAFKADGFAAGLSAGTINKTLALVSRVLNLCARKWRTNGRPWLDQSPLIEKVKGPAREPYPLTWQEQHRLFAELTPRLRALALFDVNTGLREQALLQLRWDWEVPVHELDEYRVRVSRLAQRQEPGQRVFVGAKPNCAKRLRSSTRQTSRVCVRARWNANQEDGNAFLAFCMGARRLANRESISARGAQPQTIHLVIGCTRPACRLRIGRIFCGTRRDASRRTTVHPDIARLRESCWGDLRRSARHSFACREAHRGKTRAKCPAECNGRRLDP